MRVLNLDNNTRKRVRGKKRKVRDMVDGIMAGCEKFPEIDLEDGYWHLHLPIQQAFIDSEKIPVKIRRLCIQTIVDAAAKLISMKPESGIDIRVTAFINLPALWYSEIIVFFGRSHLDGYFTRNNDYQKWIPLGEERNIAREWNLRVSEQLAIKGYKELLVNDDYVYENELWYIGEIDR